MSEHSGRVENKTNQDPNELLKRASEKGSPDFSVLSGPERQILWDWFQKKTKQDSVSFAYSIEVAPLVEQFIQYGVIGDEQAKEAVKRLSAKERGEVGIFIFQTMEDESYLRTFYQCYPDINFEEQYRIIQHYKKNAPEHLAMIAPFENITKIFVLDERKKEVLAIDEYFLIFEERSRLLEQALSADDLFLEQNIHVEELIQYFLDRHPEVLIPFLNQLREQHYIDYKDSNLTTKEIIDGCLDEAEYSWDQPENFLTRAQFDEINRVKNVVSSRNKSTYASHWEVDECEKISSEDKEKFYSILAEGKMRSALLFAQVLGMRFQDSDVDRNDFLKVVYENHNLPIITFPDVMGLSSGEVIKFINLLTSQTQFIFSVSDFRDLSVFMKWVQTQSETEKQKLYQSIEKNILTFIVNAYADEELLSGFIKNINEILSLLPETTQRKLLQKIKQKPEFWVHNIAFAFTHEMINQKSFSAYFLSKPHIFAGEYFSIFEQVEGLQKDDVSFPISTHEINQLMRRLFERQPQYVLQKKFRPFHSRFFSSPEDFHEFVSAQIRNGNVEFIKELIKFDQKKKYNTEVRNVLLSRPFVLKKILDYLTDGYITTNELLDLLEKNADASFFSEWPDKNDCIVVFSEPNSAKRFQHIFLRKADAKGVMNVFDQIQFELDDIQRKKVQLIKDQTRLTDLQKYSLGYQSQKEIANLIDRIRVNKKDVEKVEGVQSFESIQIFLEQLVLRLKQLCSQEPGLIFAEDNIKHLKEDSIPFIQRDLAQAIKFSPQIFCLGRNNSVQAYFEKALGGKENFINLVRGHLRQIIFSIDSVRGFQLYNLKALPNELKDNITAIDPLYSLNEQKEFQRGYHTEAMECVSNFRLFPLFEKRLLTLVKLYEDQNGKLTNEYSIYSTNNVSFLKEINRLVALESSPIVNKYVDWIKSLEPRAQEKLLRTLYAMVVYGLDNGEDVLEMIDTADSEKIIERLQEKIKVFVLELFDLPKNILIPDVMANLDLIQSWIIYYQQNCQDQPLMKREFQSWILGVLNGSYVDKRAWDGEKPTTELERQFRLTRMKEHRLLPKQLSLSQYEIWVSDIEIHLSELFSYEMKDVQFAVKDVFKQAVADHHITDDQIHLSASVLENMNEVLFAPMQTWLERRKELLKKITNAKNAKKNGMKADDPTQDELDENEQIKEQIRQYRELHKEDFQHLEALKAIRSLEVIHSQELETGKIKIDNQFVSIQKLIQTVQSYFRDLAPEFLSDLSRLSLVLESARKQVFSNARVSKIDLFLTDRVDAEAYFLIGEKPVTSCQSFQGNGEYAQGLLSSLIDPNIKYLQLYNEQNQIVARAAIRLLETQNGKPALFVERIYSANAHPKISESLITLAKQKAIQMNIPLFSSQSFIDLEDGQEDSLFDLAVLKSQGTRGVAVYSDAGGGLMEGGVFELEASQIDTRTKRLNGETVEIL